MKKKLSITGRGNSQDIRIYIDGIVHIIFPRHPNTCLQSWVEGRRGNTLYKIELQSPAANDQYHYESRDVWKKVLELLDEFL